MFVRVRLYRSGSIRKRSPSQGVSALRVTILRKSILNASPGALVEEVRRHWHAGVAITARRRVLLLSMKSGR
jgi:hypothetical protein